MKNRKILLINHHLVNFAGSENLTLDLANFFKEKEWDLYVATFLKGSPILNLFEKSGIKVFNILFENLPEQNFDLVWAHHFPSIIDVFTKQKVRTKNLVLSSLSPYEPLETLPIYFVEKADIVLANSAETYENILSYVNVNRNLNLRIFPNSVRSYFFRYFNPKKVNSLKNIAIVSNHPPKELLLLKKKLEKSSINLDIYGINHKFKLITPELLSIYDTVITIGKTVQYAMALGIPVYCYDHFGGPGWVTKENYEKAEYYNYSGRCTNHKKDVETILKELLEGFYMAFNYREFFYELALNKYNFEKNVESILKDIPFREDYIYFDSKYLLWLEKINEVYKREFKWLEKINEVYKREFKIRIEKRNYLDIFIKNIKILKNEGFRCFLNRVYNRFFNKGIR